MSTFSQQLQQIHQSLVIKHTNDDLQNYTTNLNKNELADKTANMVNSNNPFIETQSLSNDRQNSNNNSFKISMDEYNKQLMMYKWNKNGYYSYNRFNPTLKQHLTLKVINMVGFAVDPPPVQHTPTIINTNNNPFIET
eukprot:546770_1